MEGKDRDTHNGREDPGARDRKREERIEMERQVFPGEGVGVK